MTKKQIKGLDLKELIEICIIKDVPSFRAKQIYQWMYRHHIDSISQMNNIPVPLRDYIDKNYILNTLKIENIQESELEDTKKILFRTNDGQFIESVSMIDKNLHTVCISSQIGCSVDCKFCATGMMGFKRNLTCGEIIDQIIQVTKLREKPITNIVYMGMGEPLLNYSNVIQSIDRLTSSKGLSISKRRITLSTSGISKMIKKLADDNIGVNLALSLHAATDEKRNQIMPIGESNSLKSLKEAIEYYYSKMKKQLTYEYILFNEFNDSIEDAKNLYSFTRHTPSKVNIIEYNPIEDSQFEKSSELKMNHFISYLENKGVVVKVRRSRGKDIDAACGQLANKNKA